jgi:stage III sporulation protein SpoIIIAA
MNTADNPTNKRTLPSVSITTARTGLSSRPNAMGMRPMQERAYAKRGEQYLLIKSPPASGKSRALMFVALDKLQNQGLKQALIVVPERIRILGGLDGQTAMESMQRARRG